MLKCFKNIKRKRRINIKFIIVNLYFCCVLILPLQAFFGAKFEPPDGKVYHGAQAEVRPIGINKFDVDWQGIEEYTLAVGHRPKLILHYMNLNPMMFALLKETVEQIARQPYDYYAQIGLDFYYFPGKKKLKKRRDVTHEIVRHGYDMVLKNMAELFTRMEIPIFLRLGYEFGGDGFGSKYDRDNYIQAWRYVVDFFKEAGVSNVAFVWNNLNEKDYMAYYPGDEYVDWWAINIFDDDPGKNRLIHQFIRDAAHHKKPVMIAESAPQYIGTDSTELVLENWFKSYFELMHRYAHVKAFCYINASWKDYPDPTFTKDTRIQINPELLKFYSGELSDPRFIHAGPKIQKFD